VRALVIVALLATTAHADERPQLVVSVPLFALASRAVAIEGERPVASRLSVSLATGVRDPAGGDFGGYALAVGAAIRGWRRTDQRGAHLALRLEGNTIHLRRPGMDLGTAYGLTTSLTIGYRFVIKDHLTITPDIGYGLDIDFAHGGIPAHRRRTPVYGLSVGGCW